MEGGKRGGPTLSPSTAGSCSTMENGVSGLPTDITCDPGVGGISAGDPALGDKTNHAVQNST